MGNENKKANLIMKYANGRPAGVMSENRFHPLEKQQLPVE
jgi:hypothetical protein